MEKTESITEPKKEALLKRTISFRVDEKTYKAFTEIVQSEKAYKSLILRKIIKRVILIYLKRINTN